MNDEIKSIPEGSHIVTPNMIVQGANDAIEFYKNIFGAKVRKIFYGPDGKTVGHAELEIGDSVLMLSDEFPMMHIFSPKSPGGGTSISLYIYVDNVDDIFNKAVAAGATVMMPLMDSFWGDRCGNITDPFGHHWTLATHKKDVSDEEQDIIIGIKCPVIMGEEAFDEDKKIIESDILKAFADVLNSDICNRRREDNIYNYISKKPPLEYVPVPCSACGSTDTVGYGSRITNIGKKPRRICKKCGVCYTNQEDAIWKMKHPRYVIEDAIELSKQYSLRETAHKIKEKYDVDISYSAIRLWRNKPEFSKK